METNRKGVIYKTTNTINGKIYVGKDSCFKNNYLGSGKILLRAIVKYGRGSFIRENIDNGFRGKDLNDKEQFWIKKLKSRDPLIGYNVANGGGCGYLTEEHKRRIGDANRGKIRSQESKQRLSDIKKGIPRSPEAIEKTRQFNLGRKLSIEHRRKIGEARRRYEKEKAAHKSSQSRV